MPVVALPDFPCPVLCAALGDFLGLMCALHAGIVFLHFMYFVMDEYPRFLRRTGERVFMVLAVWHGLFPFFKVQAGLAFSHSFVKNTLFDKHFFLWESCPRCVQVVRRFLGFSDICFKLRVG